MRAAVAALNANPATCAISVTYRSLRDTYVYWLRSQGGDVRAGIADPGAAVLSFSPASGPALERRAPRVLDAARRRQRESLRDLSGGALA